MMENEHCPRRIGGGYIGPEFCFMVPAFGSKVTILQNGSVFCRKGRYYGGSGSKMY